MMNSFVIVVSTVVNRSVYNGKKRIEAEVGMFMTGPKIIECIKELKLKNTEGYDNKI